MTKSYTGIGSRETPEEVQELFQEIAEHLARDGYCLRSGGAKGADKAFEVGCDNVNGSKEIYLPWKGFEGSSSNLIVKDERAFYIAERFHPAWDRLSAGAQKLQARNSHQVLGADLETPSDFIICWTKNGSGGGGTGQAIRIAKSHGIPIYDAGSFDDIYNIKRELTTFLDRTIMRNKLARMMREADER